MAGEKGVTREQTPNAEWAHDELVSFQNFKVHLTLKALKYVYVNQKFFFQFDVHPTSFQNRINVWL